MPSPLITRPGRTAILPPQLCGQVGYYALMATYPRAVIDLGMPYDKRRKNAHRYDIADVRGPLSLTVPIEKAHRGMPWASVGISSHGAWWSDHAVSLESAYGRTPYFEFYYDRFKPLLAPPAPGLTVGDLVTRADQTIRQILALDTEVTYEIPPKNPIIPPTPISPTTPNTPTTPNIPNPPTTPISPIIPTIPNPPIPPDDYRRERAFDHPAPPPYYQVRADRLGFIPNLSILDLIFNLGPEAPLLLHQIQ